MTADQRQTGAAKMVAVLESLANCESVTEPHGMTVSEVARVLGRDKSIVSRQLKNLLESGLVSRDPDGRYELSWRLFALAQRGGDQRLLRTAVPLMRQLAATVRERAHLTVLSGDQVLTVHSESALRSIESTGWVGRSIPLLATSSGMALLMDHDDPYIVEVVGGPDREADSVAVRTFVAEIGNARKNHYAVSNRHFDPDVIGIAAPLRNSAGRIVAALNISGPAYRIENNIPAIGRLVVSTASRCTQLLTAHHPA
jgi:IclR family KDG regulon transcriptional repressor